MAKKFDPSLLIKNLTKQVQEFGRLQGERSRIQSALLANQIKGSQNWFWKMKEKQADPAYQAQQALAERYKTQTQDVGTGTIEPFTEAPQPRVELGASGFKATTPKFNKEYIYGRIQEKKRRGMSLSAKEKKFEKQYLGTGAKEPSFGQQANIESVREDLRRGRGTTYSLMGEPQPFEMKTVDDALNYLSQRKLPPDMFKEELSKYGYQDQAGGQDQMNKIVVEDSKGNQFYLPREQLQDAIDQGYKQVQ